MEVRLLDVPLLDVSQPLEPEPMDPEVAEPVPEQESSWRKMSIMSLDEELASLWFPSRGELAWGQTGRKENKVSAGEGGFKNVT